MTLTVTLALAVLLSCGGCGQAAPDDGSVASGNSKNITGDATPEPGPGEGNGEMRLTVLYDNRIYTEGLEASWGFSCLVETLGRTVLFDTGADYGILSRNMARLGIDPHGIDTVVISHAHADHSGGLQGVLDANPGVRVYLLRSFPSALKETVTGREAALVEVGGPLQLFPGVNTTGEIGGEIREQALVVESDAGPVVITGCAHPGIVETVEAAGSIAGRGAALVLGGFHLGGAGQRDIEAIVSEFRALGVSSVAPCHCTGEKAMEIFRIAYGESFLDVGAGRVVTSEDLGHRDE